MSPDIQAGSRDAWLIRINLPWVDHEHRRLSLPIIDVPKTAPEHFIRQQAKVTAAGQR